MPDQPQQLVDELRRRIADPGACLPRRFDAGQPVETMAAWRARAVAAGLEDGTLGYIPAEQLAGVQEELTRRTHTLDLVRRELGATREEADRFGAELASANQQISQTKTHFTRRADTLTARAERAEAERDQLASRLDELIEARIELSEAGHLPPTPVPGSSRCAPEAESTGVHAWSETAGLSVVVVACTRCGIVQRRDGENKPCQGPGRVELRAPEPADAARS